MAAGDAWLDDLSPTTRFAVYGCAAGRLPANIALAQLLLADGSTDELTTAIGRVLARRAEGSAERRQHRRLRSLQGMIARHLGAGRVTEEMVRVMRRDGEAADSETAIARCAAMFDRAVGISPEASVALYALGDAELLAAVTSEVVERLRGWEVLGADRVVLDIGCGIGRFLDALAGRVRLIVGVDVSGGMTKTARRRCAGVENVHVVRSAGRDLAMIAGATIDTVLAIDVFPYLRQASRAVALGHVREAARVLKPGGHLLILNYSYRGDFARDRQELCEHADDAGLEMGRSEKRAFTLWDGDAFRLAKPGSAA